MRGFSFALASTMSTLISYAFIICDSPQKSSVAQKVYNRTSLPDNDREAVFPALDGLMADADTQLGGLGRPK